MPSRGSVGRAGRDQHDGVSVADQCGPVGLFCQLSDFDRELPLSDHRADFVNIHDLIFLLYKQKNPKQQPRVLLYMFLILPSVYIARLHFDALFADSELSDHFLIAIDIVPFSDNRANDAVCRRFSTSPVGTHDLSYVS